MLRLKTYAHVPVDELARRIAHGGVCWGCGTTLPDNASRLQRECADCQREPSQRANDAPPPARTCGQCGKLYRGPGWKYCPDCSRGQGKRPRPLPKPPKVTLKQRRQHRIAAAPGTATPEQLAARWDYYRGKCWMCGNPAQHMDHVKPLLRGGSNWPANQRPACWPCNRTKNHQWPWPPRTNDGRLPSG